MKTTALSLSFLVLSVFSASADLVAHWPLDANALDATGNGHDGVVVGTVTFGQSGANANTGSSADFPDTGHIDIPFDTALNPGTQGPDGSGSFSVAFWALPTVSGGGGYRSPFTNREDNGASVNGPVIYNDANGNWSFWAGNNGASGQWVIFNTDPVAVDVWTHVAITYDADTTTRRMLLNGVEVINEVSGISANAARDMHIGAGTDFGTDFYWDGRIDDVGFWDNALTDEEVQDIMTNGITPVTPSDPNLLVASPLQLTLTGATQTFDVTVTNGGATKALNVTSATFSGANAGNFSLVSLPGPIASGGGTGVVKISFNPAGAFGQVEAIMELASNSPANPVKTVSLRGFIHDPAAGTPETRVEFGTLPAAAGTLTKTITIRNDGFGQTLNIMEVLPTGPDGPSFTVTNAPASIAPSSSGAVEITFEPQNGDGSYVSRLAITTDDPLNPVLTIVLHAEVTVTDPLVAWWPLNTDAADATGHGFDGEVIAAEPAAVTFGETGANASTATAADFSGGGHIDVPYSPLLNPTSFTVTLWALADTSGGDYASPITSRVHTGGGVTNGYIIYNTAGAPAGFWSFWTGQGVPNWDDVNGPLVTPGAWTHLAISYSAATDTKVLYVNGEIAATDTTRFALTQYSPNVSAATHIGAGDDTGLGFPFDGKIDDVALFKVALTQAQIQNIMTNGVSAPPVVPAVPFDITSVTRAPAGGAVTLGWTSVSGSTYVIQRSTDLSAWTDLTPPVNATAATATFTDPTPPVGAKVFYRISKP